MQSDKKKVLTNSLLYTSGNVLLKFFSFLLIPLYTAYLSPEQYGIINLAFGFVNVVSLLIMAGLQFSIFRFYADIKDDRIMVAEMISSVFCSIFIIGSLLSLILIVTYHFWINIIFKNIPFIPIVLLAILISIVTAIYTVYQDMLKGMQEAKKSVILSYLFFFLLLGLNIITVVIFKWGAKGILLSTFVVNFIMIIFMVIDLRRKHLLIIKIDKGLTKKLFRYSFPLVPHTLAYSITNLFSRIIINSKLSTSVLGLYSLASQFSGVADVVSNSVQSAFQPWMFQKLNEKDNIEHYEEDIRKLTHQLLWIYGLIYISIGVFAREIIDIMSSDSYHSAWQYVPFMIMTVAVKSPLYFYMNFLYYKKEATKYIFITTIYGCVVSMTLTWLLVPCLGIYGAILSDFMALLIRFLFTYKYASHLSHSIYNIRLIVGITFISICFLGIAVLPSYLNVKWDRITHLLYKICCIIVYCGLFFSIYNRKGSNIFKSLSYLIRNG